MARGSIMRRRRGRPRAQAAPKADRSKRVRKSIEAAAEALQSAHDSREFLLRNTRTAVLTSGRAIMEIHRENYREAEKMIASAAGMIEEYRKKAPAGLRYLLITSEQEMVEASALLAVARGRQVPTSSSLGVSNEGYVLGMMDSLGEIKRHVVDLLRRNEAARARRAFERMEEMYSMLYPFAAMDRVLKEARRKMDVGRIQLEDARVLLVQAHIAGR